MRTALVFPVGSRDVALRSAEDPGTFPDPAAFQEGDGDLRRRARAWGEACLASFAFRPEAEQRLAVRQHLDFPMLRRVLDEVPLGDVVNPLVFVVTDQDPPHPDDTKAFGELMRLWISSTLDVRRAVTVTMGSTIIIARDPHLFAPVFEVIAPRVPAIVNGCDEVVVVQAGGTPAMSFGAVLAVALHGGGIPVRHLHVPPGGPVVEAGLPTLVERDRVVHAARRALDERRPARAVAILHGLTGPDAGRAQEIARCAASLAARDVTAAQTPPAEIGRALEAELGRFSLLRGRAQLLRLAAWDAIRAFRSDDLDRFLNVWSTIVEHLPGQSFEANGVPADDPPALRASLPNVDWDRFVGCDLSTGEHHKLRKKLRGAQGPGIKDGDAVCRELFHCGIAARRGYKGPRCTCRQLVGNPPWLSRSLTAWGQLQRGELRKLRHITPLSHSVAPLPAGDVDEAVKTDFGTTDVEAGIRTALAPFDVNLSSDIVASLCDAARSALA